MIKAGVVMKNGKVATASLDKAVEVLADILSDKDRAKRQQKEYDMEKFKNGGKKPAQKAAPEKKKNHLKVVDPRIPPEFHASPSHMDDEIDKAIDEGINFGGGKYPPEVGNYPGEYCNKKVLPLLSPSKGVPSVSADSYGVWWYTTENYLPNDADVLATPFFEEEEDGITVELMNGGWNPGDAQELVPFPLTGDPQKDAKKYVELVEESVRKLAKENPVQEKA